MLDSALCDEPRVADEAAAPARPEQRAPAHQAEDHAELWMLGQPPLSGFLEFAEDTKVDGTTVDRAALTEQWCAAHDHRRQLERGEANIADDGDHRELDPALAPLVAQVQAHPTYRRTFDTLPARFGMVELDALVVHQWHVTRNRVDALVARIGQAPDLAGLFGICMPLAAAQAPVRIERLNSRRYAFRCASHDFGFYEPVLLPSERADAETFGAVAGIAALVLGFSSNFLRAVRVGQRVMLNNGYHRACALRALGVTHVPCIIETATRLDEVQLTVNKRVGQDARLYFESARPPLLKDFFDPKLTKLLPVRKRVRLIELSFEIRDYYVAAE